MTVRRVTLGILASFFLLSATSPFSETTCAQSANCARELNRQEAALRSLDSDLSRDTRQLIKTDVANTALKGLKAELAGDPTAEAVEEAKARYEEWREWVEQTKLTKEILDQVSKCIGAGRSGCMAQIQANIDKSSQLLKESSDAWAEATKKWIDSLGNDSVSEAAERVDNARNVIERAATRSNGLFNEAANRGIDNCLRNLEQRAQASPRDPVNLGTQTPPQPPAGPTGNGTGNGNGNGNGNGANGSGGDGGIGAGTIAGYAAAGTGAIVGAKMLSDYSQKMKCTQYETEMNTRMNTVVSAANSLIACSTVSCINSREPALNSALSAMLTTAGNWCTCLGPEAASELSPEDKAMVRDLFNDLRSAGISAGSLPACFR